MEQWISIFVAFILVAQVAALWLLPKHRSRLRFALAGVTSVAAAYLLVAGLFAKRADLAREPKSSNAPFNLNPAVLLGEKPAQWFRHRDDELFSAQWSEPKVVKRPFRPSKKTGSPGFLQQAHAFSDIENQLSPELLGEGTAYYAGVAVGDLNQDGYLDVVLGHPGVPVSVELNDRQGGFIRAPDSLFAGPVPHNAEWVALADVNADSFLDLLVLASQYGEPQRNVLYLFDPEHNRFADSGLTIGAGKKMTGGVSFTDLNLDGTLDFYISFGVDWASDDVDFLAKPYRDEFYLSEKGGWRESLATIFPKTVVDTPLIGMTALFVDADRDGYLDFLLGNDFFDPSLSFFGAKDGVWSLAGADKFEGNTINSMSYFPIDVDNDGVFEIWENGTGQSMRLVEKTVGQARSSMESALRSNELYSLHSQVAVAYQDAGISNKRRAIKCDGFVDPAVRSLCWDWKMAELAADSGEIQNCGRVVSLFLAAFCRRNHALATDLGASNSIGASAVRSLSRLDVKRYPPQGEKNVLLKRTESGIYRDIAPRIESLAYTGWSWGSFPFDINNDGLLDLYVGTGYLEWAHNVNRLLINNTNQGEVRFTRGEVDWGVDFEDETRGVAIADFDHDGDGDMILNNYLSRPLYLENQMGGKALLIELRSRANYYAIGSVIEVRTNKGIQTRPIVHGGVWNSTLPIRQHFGLAEDETITGVTVTWPGGKKQSLGGIEPGFLYVVYE